MIKYELGLQLGSIPQLFMVTLEVTNDKPYDEIVQMATRVLFNPVNESFIAQHVPPEGTDRVVTVRSSKRTVGD